MNSAIAKLKKLRGRSRAELKVRGAQALAVFAERRGWSLRARVPSDREFFALIDTSLCRAQSGEELLSHWRTRRAPAFFAAFDDAAETRAELRRRFHEADASLYERTGRMKSGRFDLLGRRELDFGDPIDWRLEPVAGVCTPLAHWSRIDFLDPRVAGDKKFTWELNRQQHFFALGRAYWRTGRESYAESFAAHADAWMDANPPARGINWASSLEVSLRAIAWLWALHFFRHSPALTPALTLRVWKFLNAHARHIETHLSTYFAPNTHLTGEALALFYLGTLLPEFRAAARWRATGARILLAQLDHHVLSDGVYFERSTYYGRYTADFYTHFLLLARANDGNKLSALADDDAGAPPPAEMQRGESGLVEKRVGEKLLALCEHLLYITRPDGTTPYFGDDDGGRLAPLDDRPPSDFRATLAVAAALFARGDFKFVAGDAPESVLWLMGAAGLRDYDALAPCEPQSQSRAFAEGGYYCLRDGWTRSSNFMLIDAGEHGARTLNYGHAHADALSFDLAASGRTLLVDPGTYTYTGASEWRDHFRSARAHNTLTIDGASSSASDGAFRWRHVAQARARAWHAHARFDYFAGEHDGYRHLTGHEQYERAVLFLKRDYWIVRDRVRASGTHSYELNFQFAPGVEPQIEERAGARMVKATADGKTALALFTFFREGEWRVGQGWVSHCYGTRTSASICRYTSEGTGAQEFITFMLPAQAARDAQVLRTNSVGGNGYDLQHADGNDLLLTNDGSCVVDDRLVSDFEWTWARFDIVGALAELLLINGRTCLLDGQTILEESAPLEYVYASRVGAELLIETNGSSRRVVLNERHAVLS